MSEKPVKKRQGLRDKIRALKNEINSGRHDGWVTRHFLEKLEKIKKNLGLSK